MSNNNNEFQDPLENYNPVEHGDALEAALAEEPVTNIQLQPFSTISPDITVREALTQLTGEGIACLMVEENDHLVGIFSDRDVQDKVALEYEAMIDKPVRDVMTDDPVYVWETDKAAAALGVMALTGYRHVPIVSLDLKPIGIVSPQRVNRFLRDHIKPG